jgi:hypothetical protein
MRRKPPLNVPFLDGLGMVNPDWGVFFQEDYTGDTGNDWTPTYTSLTTAGSVTHTGRIYRVSSSLIYFRAKIVTSGGGTSASSAGTTYISNLPATVTIDGSCQATRVTTNLEIGGGAVIASNSRIYPPTWAATTNIIVITGLIEAR